MNKKVRTAVFPVAGLGTRLLPATKVMPKEMLPIVDMPLIQLAVDEARAAGVENFVFVIADGKEMLCDHFGESKKMMDTLVARKKQAQIDILNSVILPKGQLKVARQDKALGLGHAVWCARDYIDANEPFAVLLPDDFMMCQTSCLKQMADEYSRTGHSVIAAMEVPDEDVSKYGIVTPGQTALTQQGRGTLVKGFVEKPKLEDAPSNLAVIGRYILDGSIIRILDQMVEKNQTGAGGEIQLTDAMVELLKTSDFTAYKFEGERFDCGHDLGFVKAQIAYAMTKAHLAPEITQFMIERLRNAVPAQLAKTRAA